MGVGETKRGTDRHRQREGSSKKEKIFLQLTKFFFFFFFHTNYGKTLVLFSWTRVPQFVQ